MNTSTLTPDDALSIASTAARSVARKWRHSGIQAGSLVGAAWEVVMSYLTGGSDQPTDIYSVARGAASRAARREVYGRAKYETPARNGRSLESITEPEAPEDTSEIPGETLEELEAAAAECGYTLHEALVALMIAPPDLPDRLNQKGSPAERAYRRRLSIARGRISAAYRRRCSE
jgi:hypothetical protein